MYEDSVGDGDVVDPKAERVPECPRRRGRAEARPGGGAEAPPAGLLSFAPSTMEGPGPPCSSRSWRGETADPVDATTGSNTTNNRSKGDNHKHKLLNE